MQKRYVVNQTDHYTIDYVAKSDGTIALYAVDHPHDPHQAGVVNSHVYADGQICVRAGNEPRDMDRAKAIAVQFMEGFSSYIRTGTFPNKGRRIRV